MTILFVDSGFKRPRITYILTYLLHLLTVEMSTTLNVGLPGVEAWEDLHRELPTTEPTVFGRNN